jgi:hypothetical protein
MTLCISADLESDVFTEYVCALYFNVEATLGTVQNELHAFPDGLAVADRGSPRARTLRLALWKSRVMRGPHQREALK